MAAQQEVLETFHIECQAEALPPTTGWVDAKLKETLPPGCRVLQWAIVKSNPDSGMLSIEGCMLNGRNQE